MLNVKGKVENVSVDLSNVEKPKMTLLIASKKLDRFGRPQLHEVGVGKNNISEMQKYFAKSPVLGKEVTLPVNMFPWHWNGKTGNNIYLDVDEYMENVK
jgi:hypothetical protein